MSRTFLNGITDPRSAAAGKFLRSDASGNGTWQFAGVPNGWIDVTANAIALVLPGNTAAANVTAINAILAAAPANSTIYFPGGSYSFNAAWTMPAANAFAFQGQNGQVTGGATILAWTSNVAGSFITIGNSAWYTTFQNISFVSSGVTQTAGAVVECNGASSINFFNCSFSALGGGFLFNCLSGGTPGSGNLQSWNTAIISGCVMNNYKGTGIIVDSNNSSLVVEECVIQGQWGPTTGSPAAAQAVAGVQAARSGALQIVTSDILGNINNLLLNPAAAQVNASCFVANVYFDSSGGSCVKITGAGATVRARFDTCSFTTAGTNFTTAGTGLSAFEVSNTNTFGVGGQGIDIVNCNILNTFATTGTSNGFLSTGAADFSISNCRIAGWTNGVNVTPLTAGVTAPQLLSNTIGPAGGYPANANGITLNAGAVTYGNILIQGNNLLGNTNQGLSDSSSFALTATKNIANNSGHMRRYGKIQTYTSGGAASLAPRGAVTTGTTETFLFTGKVFANATVTGQQFRVQVMAQTSLGGTVTFSIRTGAAGTTADTQVFLSATSGAQATNAYQQMDCIVETVAVGASATTTAHGFARAQAALLTQTTGAEVLANVNTAADWFITVSATCATAGTLTVKDAYIEAM